MNKFIIGTTLSSHGLIGCLKMQKYYPYSDEILLKCKIFIKNSQFNVQKVFGRVKEFCILKLAGIDNIKDASIYKNEQIIAEVSEGSFYSFHMIGYTLFRDSKKVGSISNIKWINGIEFLDLENEMITIDQIKYIKNQSVYI